MLDPAAAAPIRYATRQGYYVVVRLHLGMFSVVSDSRWIKHAETHVSINKRLDRLYKRLDRLYKRLRRAW